MEGNKILILQTASIGDVILATSLIESIHATYPGAHIDVLVKKGTESLFLEHPFIHEVIVWDKSTQKYLNLLKVIRQVRKQRYTLLINVQRFFSSGLIAVCSGAASIHGFKKNPLSFLFQQAIEHQIGDGTHEIERNFELVRTIEEIALKPPRLYPGLEARQKAESYREKPYITISPASLWFTKQFPEDRWVMLISSLPDTYRILLLGSRNDQDLCNRLIQKSPGKDIKSLAGRLSLLESAAIMQHSRMNYVNDSAPMHLASAVNAPTKAIFCSTVPAFGFGPLSSEAEIIETEKSLPCRPCGIHGLRKCPEGHFECAYTIDMNTLIKGL